MTDLLTELRARTEARIKLEAELRGDDAPVVRMARLILADAEEIAESLAEEWLTTAEVAARTGWRAETLQRTARAVVAGEREKVRGQWRGLIVREAGRGYEFLLASVPAKRERAA